MIARSADVRSALRARQRGFLLNPYRFGSGALAGRINAYLGSAWGAFSAIYVLDTSHIGSPLIRVRRASDDAEDDIGHDADGVIDIAAALAFAGGSDLFVRKAYDHKASNDIEQTTHAAQPRIASGGVFDKGLKFDGTDDFFATPSVTSGIPGMSVLMTYSLGTTPPPSTRVLFEMPSPNFQSDGFVWLVSNDVTGAPDNLAGSRWLTGDGTHFADIQRGDSGDAAYYLNSGAGNRHTIAAVIDRSQSVNANQIKIAIEDGQYTSGSAGPNLTSPVPSNNFGGGVLYIASRSGSSLFADMLLQNLVIYTAAKSMSDMAAAAAAIPLYT